MVGARRVRNEKPREDRYREGYVRSLEGKRVEGDEDNVEHMREQVKRAIVEIAREVCGSVRVGGNNPRRVWWNDEIKAEVRIKEAGWKEVLVASDEEEKERCMEAFREEKRKVIRSIIQNKKKVNEQFGRKINEDVTVNRKLFWKEVSNTKGGKVQSCRRVKNVNEMLTQ